MQVAALVPDIACCVFIRKKTFSTIQNNLAFIWDKCCHLMTRLHLMEPHCIPQEFGFSLVNTPRVLGSKLKNKRLAPALAAEPRPTKARNKSGAKGQKARKKRFFEGQSRSSKQPLTTSDDLIVFLDQHLLFALFAKNC